jgi:hypothetical protein
MKLGKIWLSFGYQINKSCIAFVLPFCIMLMSFVLYLCLFNEIREDLRLVYSHIISLS